MSGCQPSNMEIICVHYDTLIHQLYSWSSGNCGIDLKCMGFSTRFIDLHLKSHFQFSDNSASTALQDPPQWMSAEFSISVEKYMNPSVNDPLDSSWTLNRSPSQKCQSFLLELVKKSCLFLKFQSNKFRRDSLDHKKLFR